MTQFYNYVAAKMAKADTVEALELERSNFLGMLESLLDDKGIARPDFDEECADVERAYSERMAVIAPECLLAEFKEAMEGLGFAGAYCEGDENIIFINPENGHFLFNVKKVDDGIVIADDDGLFRFGPVTSITVADGKVYGQQRAGEGFVNVFEIKGND